MIRVFDVLLSSLAIAILTPLFLIVAIALRLTGEGEIFYTQQRVGRGGQPFPLLKFATMLKNSPNMEGGAVTVKDDPRILPFGKFLRDSKINELPQLINIFLGHMSVVGPRPLHEQTFACYSREQQISITSVRPGLSGIGSIIFRNEENLLSGERARFTFYENQVAPYKGELEAWFVENKSVKNYLLVIFATLWVVFFKSSSLPWRMFSGLPIPPPELQSALGFTQI